MINKLKAIAWLDRAVTAVAGKKASAIVIAALLVGFGLQVDQRENIFSGADATGGQIAEENNHGVELPKQEELSEEDTVLAEMISAVSIFCTAQEQEIGLVFTDGENFADVEELEVEALSAIEAFRAIDPDSEQIPSDDDICEFVEVPELEADPEVPEELLEVEEGALTNSEVAKQRAEEQSEAEDNSEEESEESGDDHEHEA